jgi:hypothetical protein
MAASDLARAAMTMVGRAIGLIVLCFLVGLLLSRLGITAHGILTDTWVTILSVFVLLADWMQWALPYILLGRGCRGAAVPPLDPAAFRP